MFTCQTPSESPQEKDQTFNGGTVNSPTKSSTDSIPVVHAMMPSPASGTTRDSDLGQIQPVPEQVGGSKPTSLSAPDQSNGQSCIPNTTLHTAQSSVTTTSKFTATGSHAASPVVAGVKRSTPAVGICLQPQQVGHPLIQMTSVSQSPGSMVIAVPRATTPQPTAPTPRPPQPQTKSVQLPTNFQIPPGMVLIRSDSGQLMLVSQQALAQAQAQQGKVLRTSSGPASTAIPPIPQVIVKAPSPLTAQTSQPGTRPVIQPGPVPSTATASAQKESHTTMTRETLENVKKCKNFLVTLIKLASSGTQSADMAKNVRELVKQLLDGSLEPDAFTDQLYKELKSTPQPYLVPFLKKSLPAVRQLTPNPQLFIQQVDQPKPQEPTQQTSNGQTSNGQTSTQQVSNGQTSNGQTLNRQTSTQQTSTQQTPTQQTSIRVPTLLSANIKPSPLNFGQASKATLLVMQTPRRVAGKAVYMSTQTRTVNKITVLQSGQHHNPTGGFVFKRPAIPASTAAVIKQSFSNVSASYREYDDINDVTSMAGVNLSEESARIMAGSQAMVGSTERSCTDEPFLSPGPLLACILHTGEALGVCEVGPDVVSLVSHSVQEHLRGLLEKATVVARHRLMAHNEDPWHTHVSDVRSQLRFLEQLEHLEKQRRDDEERERLLRIAKSRSNSEDPDQQLLKQRAKELQQLEQARLQHRQANLAALAALGPRKKRLLDSAGSRALDFETGTLNCRHLPMPLNSITQRNLLPKELLAVSLFFPMLSAAPSFLFSGIALILAERNCKRKFGM